MLSLIFNIVVHMMLISGGKDEYFTIPIVLDNDQWTYHLAINEGFFVGFAVPDRLSYTDFLLGKNFFVSASTFDMDYYVLSFNKTDYYVPDYLEHAEDHATLFGQKYVRAWTDSRGIKQEGGQLQVNCTLRSLNLALNSYNGGDLTTPTEKVCSSLFYIEW